MRPCVCVCVCVRINSILFSIKRSRPHPSSSSTMFPILLLLHPVSAGPWNQEPNIHHLLSRVTPSPFHNSVHTHHTVPGSCTCSWLMGFLFHWSALIWSLLCSSHVWTSDTLSDPLRSFEKLRWLHARMITQVDAHFYPFLLLWSSLKDDGIFWAESSDHIPFNDLESGLRRKTVARISLNVWTQHGEVGCGMENQNGLSWNVNEE